MQLECKLLVLFIDGKMKYLLFSFSLKGDRNEYKFDHRDNEYFTVFIID